MKRSLFAAIIISLFASPTLFAQNVGISTNSPQSRLDVAGSLGTAIQTITGATTLDATHSTIMATPSSAYTITLPTAATSSRRVYTIVYNGTSGGNTITIKGSGTENISSSGALANTYLLTGGSITLQSNGTSWFASTAVVPTIQGWTTKGNAGTTQPAVPATYGTSTIGTTENFLGTTDAKDLVIGTSNIERIRVLSGGKVGIGLAAVPKAGIGYAKFALDGTVSNAAGPHVQYTTTQDNYPVFQQLNWSHDNIAQSYDAYYDGSNWKHSGTTGAFQLYKINGAVNFLYSPASTAAANVTWSNGWYLNTTGNMGIGNTSPGANILNVSTSAASTGAGAGINLVGQTGGANGQGGNIIIGAGQGGGSTTTSTGGGGGNLTLSAGNGGTSGSYGTTGGSVTLAAGNSSFCSGCGLTAGNVNIYSGGPISGASLTPGNINFYTGGTGTGTSPVQRMYIQGSNGYVGIGSTNPQAVLEVSAAATDVLKLTSTFGGAGNRAYIDFLTYSGTGVNARIGGVDLNSYNGGIVFETGNNGTANGTGTTERVRINNIGYVGINTTTPNYPLDVELMSGNMGSTAYSYFAKGGSSPATGNSSSSGSTISIYAMGRVACAEVDAFSDRRIKKDFQLSNAAQDLETLSKIEVTNFKYRDVVANSPDVKKGFIAQQVESVYGEAVSKNVGFIPNIYAISQTAKYDAAAHTLTVTMDKAHELTKGDKVRLITDNGTKEVMVASINSLVSFTVNDWSISTNSVFVYGKQVDDFRAVDYDRIYTLNVSATQELAKQVIQLQQQNTQLQKENSDIKTDINSMKASIEKMESVIGNNLP